MTPETIEEAETKEQSTGEKPVPLPDDPEPDSRFKENALSAALADALKPIGPATDEIWSPDAARQQTRDALGKAYGKATQADGPLGAKYAKAMASFAKAAGDLLSTTGGGTSKLDSWIAAYLDKGKPIETLFRGQTDLAKRLAPRGADRETKRDEQRATTARYADAYKAWADPVGTIDGMIGSRADEIDTLNADINVGRDADYAIYRLWFEHAPKLLQLSPKTVDDTAAPGLGKITAALTDFQERKKALQSGIDRKDGSIWLVDAGGFAKARQDVLDGWKAAAKKQAEAEANFTLRPDDTATLKARLDAAAQGEADAAKALLVQPANP